MSTCTPHHDWAEALLTAGLCSGLIVSYLPQHLRIIINKTSEGIHPWFLLLGGTSSAAGMLNMLVMQWEVIKCCKYLSAGLCLESVGGVIMVGLQWFMFNGVLVLYVIYYPQHLKYAEVPVDHENTVTRQNVKVKNVKTDLWRLSIIVSWVVSIHFLLLTFVTFLLLLTNPPSPEPGLTRQLSLWATFLGVSSAGLAVMQYAPQISHTYQKKLVGALSIPMMCMQTPGTVFMVVSIILRPGTNWTSWITFAVTGVMQGTLLCMCVAWKTRQNKLGIDDFGNKLIVEDGADAETVPTEEEHASTEATPLLTPQNSAVKKKGSERMWKRRFGFL